MVKSYLSYLLRAGNQHSVHSPFIYDLYTRVIRPDADSHSDYTALKKLREAMLASDETIQVTDFGAGSRRNSSDRRKIADIARNAQKPEKFARLFHRLVRHFQPHTLLELGTSLGITTAYLAKPAPEAQVISLEGCPETSRIALENLHDVQVNNTRVITGNIDETLPAFLAEGQPRLDLVYFDANHRYEPTLRYFNQCLPFAHNGSLFILDDIYWSPEMKKAWKELKGHPMVTVTVDLFWVGLVFFRKEQRKENFILRF